MPIEQMNISLPPKMARFIRGKVKAGAYTNASEVVRDAVRHMQELEIAGTIAAHWLGSLILMTLPSKSPKGMRRFSVASISRLTATMN